MLNGGCPSQSNTWLPIGPAASEVRSPPSSRRIVRLQTPLHMMNRCQGVQGRGCTALCPPCGAVLCPLSFAGILDRFKGNGERQRVKRGRLNVVAGGGGMRLIQGYCSSGLCNERPVAGDKYRWQWNDASPRRTTARVRGSRTPDPKTSLGGFRLQTAPYTCRVRRADTPHPRFEGGNPLTRAP